MNGQNLAKNLFIILCNDSIQYYFHIAVGPKFLRLTSCKSDVACNCYIKNWKRSKEVLNHE